MAEGLTGYDIDGVIGKLDPTDGVVISGRTFAEYDDVCRHLAQRMPVYIRGSGAYGDRQAAAEFKALMINGLDVTTYYEDDETQADIIRAACPGVTVVIVT